ATPTCGARSRDRARTGRGRRWRRRSWRAEATSVCGGDRRQRRRSGRAIDEVSMEQLELQQLVDFRRVVVRPADVRVDDVLDGLALEVRTRETHRIEQHLANVA